MKRIFYCCLLSSVLVLTFFHQAFLTQFITCLLQTYSIFTWGQPLQYETLFLKNNQLIINHPRIEKRGSFEAEQMSLSIDFDWSKWLFTIGIDIDQPHWHFKTPVSSILRGYERWLIRDNTWFRINSELRMTNGILTWVSDDQLHHHLQFHIRTNSQKGGEIKLYFQRDPSESNSLSFQIINNSQQTKIACHCEKVDIPSLFAFSHLLGVRLSPFNAIEWLKGELDATLEANVSHLGIGDIHLQHFQTTRLSSKLKNCEVICHFGEVKGYAKALLAPNKRNFWDSVEASLFLDDGEIRLNDVSMSNIRTHLLVQQGSIKQSYVTFQLMRSKSNSTFIEGHGKFSGSFDDQCLKIGYCADHFKIENENLNFESNGLNLGDSEWGIIGTYQVDLKTQLQRGIAKIFQGSCFEKNSGLTFHDIHGIITFENDFLHISPLEADCKGIFLSGDLKLDYPDPSSNVFELTVNLPTLCANVLHIKDLFRELSPHKFSPFFDYIPLEGEITARGTGLNLHCKRIPKEDKFQIDMHGIMSEGSLSFGEEKIALKGLCMDIDYYDNQQLLEFKDIQATLLVGKPQKVEEYFLMGNHIRIHEPQSCTNIELDIGVHDHQKELLRLVGYTTEQQAGVKDFHLDPHLSHISCIYPKTWECQIKDWSKVEQFELQSQFSVSHFLHDLARYIPGNFTPCFFDKGIGELTVCLKPDESYSFQLEVHHPLHYGMLKLRKQNEKWLIDKLQWDDWNLYAELHQLENRWKIPFFGLNIKDTLLLGLEGDFDCVKKKLQTNLKFSEIHLEKLNHWESLQALVSQWQPQGTLKIKGSLQWSPLSTDFLKGLEGSLSAEINELKLREHHLKIINPLQIEIKEDQISFSLLSQIQKQPFQMHCKTILPFCQEGECTFTDSQTSQPLVIFWENHSKTGLTVNSMKGEFSGCRCHMTKNEDDSKNLTGEMIVNFNRLSSLLPYSIAEKLQNLKIDSSYAFVGAFSADLNFSGALGILEMINFKGKLKSEGASLKGYRFQNLEADLQYNPGRLDIQNFSIEDPAGALKGLNFVATFDRKKEDWSINIPQLIVNNFRPSQLKKAKAGTKLQPDQKIDSWVFKQIELHDFLGDLNRQETWQAKGHFHFFNPFPLMNEKIIGNPTIDSNILNPMTGIVYFKLHGDRLYLTRFKDVFSQGRGSKFYLVNGSNPSWIDFKGNLSIQLRMKQHHSIFKIAEFFTLSIQGNIKKPHYALHQAI